MTQRLGYEPCLKNVATYWLEQNYQPSPRGRKPHPNPRYWDLHRIRKFEDWLWTQNVRLVRDNKQYYLEFLNPSTASLFALKWSQSPE